MTEVIGIVVLVFLGFWALRSLIILGAYSGKHRPRHPPQQPRAFQGEEYMEVALGPIGPPPEVPAGWKGAEWANGLWVAHDPSTGAVLVYRNGLWVSDEDPTWEDHVIY